MASTRDSWATPKVSLNHEGFVRVLSCWNISKKSSQSVFLACFYLSIFPVSSPHISFLSSMKRRFRLSRLPNLQKGHVHLAGVFFRFTHGIGDPAGNPPDVFQTRMAGGFLDARPTRPCQPTERRFLAPFGSEVFSCASVSGSQMLPGSVVPDSWWSPRLAQWSEANLDCQGCKPMRLSVCCTYRPTYMHTNVHVSCKAVKIFYLNKGRH